MKLKKLLAVLLCLTFAMAVLTGCGGDEKPAESIYEAEDLSANLDLMVYSDGELKVAFVDGVCYIDVIIDDETMEAVDMGPYTWDGDFGTIEGDANYLTFTIDDGVLVMEDTDENIYALPAMEDISYEEDTDDNVSLIENTTWWLEDLEYTFLPGGVLQAHNNYSDMSAEGIYTWNPDNMSGTVTIEGEYQDFLYRDGRVIIIDGLGDEYPLNPMSGNGAGAGGVNDDGMGDPGFYNRSFYYENMELAFTSDGRTALSYAGDDDFEIGHFDWDPHSEYGMIEFSNGLTIKFAWDGDDMFIYDEDGEEYWMDDEPDPEYFDWAE